MRAMALAPEVGCRGHRHMWVAGNGCGVGETGCEDGWGVDLITASWSKTN